jgi:hypothetical protein
MARPASRAHGGPWGPGNQRAVRIAIASTPAAAIRHAGIQLLMDDPDRRGHAARLATTPAS